MNYLTAEQVLFIHARLIVETGGAHDVRELGLLLSAVARPQATFDGQDLYPDLFMKAAALLESLIGNYAFVDGNKRTAITSTGLFFLREWLSSDSKQSGIRNFHVSMCPTIGLS